MAEMNQTFSSPVYGLAENHQPMTNPFQVRNWLLGLFLQKKLSASAHHFICDFFNHSLVTGMYLDSPQVVHDEVANRSILPG